MVCCGLCSLQWLYRWIAARHARKKGQKPLQPRHLVRPKGTSSVRAAAAEKLELTAVEQNWIKFQGPAANGFLGRAFYLPSADAARLEASLAEALRLFPHLAGRAFKARAVALTNDGVAFSVDEASEATAPRDCQASDLLFRFVDYCCCNGVSTGREPFVTAKLTYFKDGTAILGLGTSHALLDGTSAWAFVSTWAKLARGESVAPAKYSRQHFQQLLLDEATFCSEYRSMYGEEANCRVGRIVTNVFGWMLLPALDFALLALGRHLFFAGSRRIYYSPAELARIKEAVGATTTPGLGQGSWITTQEAVVAHIVTSLGRALLPPESKGVANVSIVYDMRPFLKLDPNHSYGCGFLDVASRIEGVHTKGLREVAQTLHDVLQERKTETIRAYKVLLSGFSHGLGLTTVMKQRSPFPSDLEIFINNQTKQQLPDFGQGPAQHVRTENPAAWLPDSEGIQVNILCTKPSGSAEANQRAYDLLRQVP